MEDRDGDEEDDEDDCCCFGGVIFIGLPASVVC